MTALEGHRLDFSGSYFGEAEMLGLGDVEPNFNENAARLSLARSSVSGPVLVTQGSSQNYLENYVPL